MIWPVACSQTYNSTTMANNPVYNASSQTTQLDVGSAIQEQYTFDAQTGLLTNQKVKQGSTTHVDLEYNYTLANATNNVGAKTGQLAFIKDNKNTERNRKFVYDKLGRLQEAKGGASFTRWSQTYSYDRWGQSPDGNEERGGCLQQHNGSGWTDKCELLHGEQPD